MKSPSLLAVLLVMSVPACTTYDLSKGTGIAWGDSINFTQTYHGDSIHWDSNSHSVIYDANGRMLGNIAAGVADVLIANGVAVAVKHGAVNGVQLLTATVPSGIQKVSSRRTNRATPTPKPK